MNYIFSSSPKSGRHFCDLLFLYDCLYVLVIVSSYEAMKDLFKLHDTSASRFEFAFVPDRNYGKNLGKKRYIYNDQDCDINKNRNL